VVNLTLEGKLGEYTESFQFSCGHSGPDGLRLWIREEWVRSLANYRWYVPGSAS
jgi:hypothetical protein